MNQEKEVHKMSITILLSCIAVAIRLSGSSLSFQMRKNSLLDPVFAVGRIGSDLRIKAASKDQKERGFSMNLLTQGS